MMSPEASGSSRSSSPERNLVNSNKHSPNREGAFSKRITKSNPLLHGQGDGRETRRKLFLRRVREDSEDKRWKARGGDDEMMRTIWIAEQRRRAERQARDAQGWAVDVDEQDMQLYYGAGNLSLGMIILQGTLFMNRFVGYGLTDGSRRGHGRRSGKK